MCQKVKASGVDINKYYRKEDEVKRKASFFVITSSLLLLLALFVSTGVAKGSRNDAPEACGPKFSLVPSENIYSGAAKGQNSLLSVATNGDQVVAVGFYEKRMYNLKGEYIRDRKSGLIEVWDGTKMLAKPVDLGGFENEMNWIARDPAGGFKLVGTVWEMTVKGLRSQIVVGRFDGEQFVKETIIAVPGSVRNIPHRILVSGSTAWITGYFTRQFGDPPTTLKPSFVQMDRPYPYMSKGVKNPLAWVKGAPKTLPPYTKGEARTYPLLAKMEGTAWKQVRFPGEGWLDGVVSRSSSHLMVVGMGNGVSVAYELQEKTWRSLEMPDWLKLKDKSTDFNALLDVITTPGGIIFSYVEIGFSQYQNKYPSEMPYQMPYAFGKVGEMTADGRFWQLGSLEFGADRSETKVLVSAIPGHSGVRFYGINRPYSQLNEGRIGRVGRALFYPGYREEDYPFRFRGGGIATTRTEVWVVGSLNETESRDWQQTAVLRACPPLKVVAGTETPPSTETP